MKITNKHILFWTGQDVFSNFYLTNFEHQHITFFCAEQAIMYRKAKLFKAEHIANEILAATTPNECKKLGRSREIPFNQEIWNKEKKAIFFEVLVDKFYKENLNKQLLSSSLKGKKFVEASPYDKIWGVGLKASDPAIDDESKWRGLNLLGLILDDVRAYHLSLKDIKNQHKKNFAASHFDCLACSHSFSESPTNNKENNKLYCGILKKIVHDNYSCSDFHH